MAGAFARERNKLIAAGAILVAAIVIFYFQFGSGDGPLPDRVTYVCVATGETYQIPRGKLKWLPLENPDTGEKTLLPCTEQEDGIYVSYRCRDVLKELGDINKCVDVETLRVRGEP